MDDRQQTPDLQGDQPPDRSASEGASGERFAATPDMEAETPEAGAVPPGYDWPTHGGYLGCLLGMMPACLVAGFLSSTFVAWPWLNGKSDLPPIVAGMLIVLLFAVCVYGFGRIGWVLGRRFYRKYPRNELSWGEDEGTADTGKVPRVRAEGTRGTASDQTTRQATQ